MHDKREASTPCPLRAPRLVLYKQMVQVANTERGKASPHNPPSSFEQLGAG